MMFRAPCPNHPAEGPASYCWACDDYVEKLLGRGDLPEVPSASEPPAPVQESLLGDQPEDQIQHGIKKFLAALPAKYSVNVWDSSQPFRAAIRPGLPDLLVFWTGGMFFVECKTRTGKQSEGQTFFEAACKRAGVPYYVWRSVNDAAAWWNQREVA